MSLTRLVELARSEQQAIDRRRWDLLVEIRTEQLAILRQLQGRLTPSALPALELVLDRCRTTEKMLVERMAETRGVIERLGTGRQAVRGYAGGARRRGGIEIHV